MLRDIHVPWHMIVPLTLVCVLLFTFVPTTLATSAVHAQRLGNRLYSGWCRGEGRSFRLRIGL